ncbi:VOC family protein [Roseateles chitinivorans]|uniref:VOC family protein n=1 Tax=Roseateles chitinivorans TaxID=2917965 RepID=UPI003D667075
MTTLDHIEFAVSDSSASLAFYKAALKPLGMDVVVSLGPSKTRAGSRHGLGADGYPRVWIHDGKEGGAGLHLALSASKRSQVDAFWKSAVAAGGVDNGPPGVRERYHDHYYAAYVLDPDGNNIEVVCQAPT